MSDRRLDIGKAVLERCFELAVTGAVDAAALGEGWPVEPGACSRDATGNAEMLHFAPGRWLLPAPSPQLLARVSDRPGVECIDVEGKWQRRLLRGDRALRALAAGADVEAMLANRGCAAMSLFECPVIVACHGGRNDNARGGFGGDALDLWVPSSYATFMDEQLAAADAVANQAPSPGTIP